MINLQAAKQQLTGKGDYMDDYIAGNKAAWEEAFDNRDASWGADITERIQKEEYPFFEKEMALILLNEQHPCTNMLATDGDEGFEPEHRKECHFSYFDHEWTGNGGIYYMTLKSYQSKTFTDYTHPMSEIITGMCNNGIVITGLQEFDHDISGALPQSITAVSRSP